MIGGLLLKIRKNHAAVRVKRKGSTQNVTQLVSVEPVTHLAVNIDVREKLFLKTLLKRGCTWAKSLEKEIRKFKLDASKKRKKKWKLNLKI